MYIVGSRIRQEDARGRRPLSIATTNPAVHPDEGLAIMEATRLSSSDYSRDYIVFKAIVSVGPKESPVEVTRIE